MGADVILGLTATGAHGSHRLGHLDTRSAAGAVAGLGGTASREVLRG